MPFSIQTNLLSLITQRNLNRSQRGLTQAVTRLSSGYRINSAADDASGLAISENLRAHIRSFAQAERNANNAISMAQTAEGGADSITSVIVRMRELAVQASNGSLSSDDRGLLDTEYQALKLEIDRLAETTEFNGTDLLAGNVNTISFQVGIHATNADTIDVTFGGVSTTSLGVQSSGVSGSSAGSANSAITLLDSALTTILTTRAGLGAATNRLTFAVTSAEDMRINLAAAESSIRDADIATETALLARHQVLVQAGMSVLSQANQMPALALLLLGE